MTAYSFPTGFLWGSATSAHQVEGQNVHNDWWAWEQAGRVKTPSGAACDHYRRFADDFDLAASLHQNAHRFSVEWSRVEPAEGRFDEAALSHYRDVVRALLERRLEPVVTLHHYTSPRWIAQAGGWANSAVVERFARFTEQVVRVLGRDVRYWVTINEPMVFVNMHYVEGLGPPGAQDLKLALRVIEHLIRAHALAYKVLHDASPSAQVSVAKHLPVFEPCRPWWLMDVWASGMTDRLFNGAFLEAVTEGRWRVPGVGTWTIPEAAATLDYLGVNFYGRQIIRWTPGGSWLGGSCDLGRHPRRVRERTSFGWDVDPASFVRTLRRGGRLGLPVLVTENGTWMDDDARRWRFIARHLGALAQAAEAGVTILGYLYWSLLDNFEWAHGYGPRFGLIEVDYATQARRVRESARRYAEVCRTNQLVIDA
jgi:beta-glucosidase